MKTRYISMLFFFLGFISIPHIAAQNTMNSPQDIGTYSINFFYSDMKYTPYYTNDYTGRNTKDVFYRFTLSVPMEITISHCGSHVQDTYLHLLNAEGVRIAYNDDYTGPEKECNNPQFSYLKKQLTPGTYYVVSEGYSQDGNIMTNINGNIVIPDCIDMGAHSTVFVYEDTQDTRLSDNRYGQTANDVFYKLTLSTSMELTISHCGSQLYDTYLHVLNEQGIRIAYNDDYKGSDRCSNTYHSYIKGSFAPGVYYIVSEGNSDNGNITTRVEGAMLLPVQSAEISMNQNYIFTRTLTRPVKNADDITLQNSVQAIQYFDGLGRPVQATRICSGPGGNDITSYIQYDTNGRKSRQWIPTPVQDSNGTFITHDTFENTAVSYFNDSRSFSEVIYENSPLARVLGEKGPGEDWMNHPARMDYETNGDNEVKNFLISNETLFLNGYYKSGSLLKTKYTDEDGISNTSYQNKLGQVIMTRQSSDHDTYYVYDDFGNQRYVLPPLAADGMDTGMYGDDHIILKQYGYVYKYDSRGHVIEKRMPGSEAVYMVYDQADRLVLSQTATQRQKNKWTVNKYDALGRLLYNAEIVDSQPHETWINWFSERVMTESFSTGSLEWPMSDTGYSRNHFHNRATNILTVNYYDNYHFLELPTYSENKEVLIYRQKSGYGSPYDNVTGLLTGTRTYLLDGSGTYLTDVYYYDYRGRIIQTRSTNHLGGYDIGYAQYDFAGNVLKSLKEHSTGSLIDNPVAELYEYTYDHAGRLIDTHYTLITPENRNPERVLLSGNQYDELGRLKTKQQHNKTNAVNYEYNVRNWLTQIRDGSFEQNLHYQRRNALGISCYNGNISAMEWTYNGIEKRYDYQYDELKRLIGGYTDFYRLDHDRIKASYMEEFSYDKHGNILTLKRSDYDSPMQSTQIKTDDLLLSYTGNQLIQVQDYAGSSAIYGLKEYNDRNNTGNDFTYDSNGNTIADKDRNIKSIKYNLLNLPEEVLFDNGNKITNLYAADGRKLSSLYLTNIRQVINPIDRDSLIIDEPGIFPGTGFGKTLSSAGTSVDNSIIRPNPESYTGTGTQYAGNFEYRSVIRLLGSRKDTLERIHNSEGYVDNHDDLNPLCRQNYYRKDYLGNNREVWRPSYKIGRKIIKGVTSQRTQYYPSGLPWSEGEGAGVQPYKAEGKEFIEMHGLDEYYSIFRNYYSTIGRPLTMDPHMESYYSISPYAWCGNNWVNFIDPDGRDWINQDGTIQWTDSEEQIKAAKEKGTYLGRTTNGEHPNGDIYYGDQYGKMHNTTPIKEIEIVAPKSGHIRDVQAALDMGIYKGHAAFMDHPMTLMVDMLLFAGGGGFDGLISLGKAIYNLPKLIRGAGNSLPKVANGVSRGVKAVPNGGKDIYSFTAKAASRMAESSRVIPVQILDDVINVPMAIAKDPQGTNALMHYSQMWKTGTLYNVEVLYDKTTNTIMHFKYTQKPLGPLNTVK